MFFALLLIISALIFFAVIEIRPPVEPDRNLPIQTQFPVRATTHPTSTSAERTLSPFLTPTPQPARIEDATRISDPLLVPQPQPPYAIP